MHHKIINTCAQQQSSTEERVDTVRVHSLPYVGANIFVALFFIFFSSRFCLFFLILCCFLYGIDSRFSTPIISIFLVYQAYRVGGGGQRICTSLMVDKRPPDGPSLGGIVLSQRRQSRGRRRRPTPRPLKNNSTRRPPTPLPPPPNKDIQAQPERAS